MTADILKIIFLGDIFGEPGRRALNNHLKRIKDELNPDLIIANGENAANGRGISKRIFEEMQKLPIDVFTSGNHIYQVKDIFPVLNDDNTMLMRPYNYPRGAPGKGYKIVETKMGLRVGVVNLLGSLFMQTAVNNPFESIDSALMEMQGQADIILVDFHAEATSEKRALGWHLDGKVSLLVGTHTHVLTADDEILPNGTGYISDLGMCGPYDSVIGMDKEIILKRLKNFIPNRFEVAKESLRICGIYAEINTKTKATTKITRIDERL